MIITQTPLRVSFFGGNSDFPDYYLRHGGAVLTTAIDKYIYCIIKERFDDEIRITYSIKEIVKSVDDIKHELVREAMKLVGVEKGVEIMFLSDIPSEGSGLGSSSSVTVGILNALHQCKGEQITNRQLAEEACHIEIDVLKKPIGIQDQYIAAFGGLNLIEFGQKEVAIYPAYLSDIQRTNLENSLMLFYTGLTRKSSEILSKMKLDKDIISKGVQMAYDGLVDIDTENQITLGERLNEYWNLKKKLNGAVSNEVIDSMYRRAMKAGALGGKITGAGGGGFLLLVVPEGKRDAVRNELRLRELPFGLAKDGSKVIFNIRK